MRTAFMVAGQSALLGALVSTASVLPVMAQQAAPVTTQAQRENPNPNDWLMVHQNYFAHRFAQTTQITTDNIANLHVAYTLALAGVEGGGSRYANASLEGTPIAEDGRLYVTNGWGNLYKIDARSGNQARIEWMMDPELDKPWAGDVACCGVNNRGVALWNDKVISVALDGRVIATDKATGEVVWELKDADPAIAETFTVAPLVVGDIAIVGPAGAEYGIRGWLDGIDLNTGQRAWRTWTVAGPDDPLGNGVTWATGPGVAPATYKTGGGSIWVTGTYDPALNLTYWGTGNPGPDWDTEYRPGDNLYTDSVLALTPESGEINWYFQYTPNDPFDFDEIGEHPLVDTNVNGKPMRLVVHAGRNGFFYGFDRTNGEFVYGQQYVNDLNWTDGLDPKTGKPVAYDPSVQLQNYGGPQVQQTRAGNVGTICPVHTGGKNWEPSAYSPATNMLYVAGGEGCNQHVAAAQTPPVDQGGTWKPRDRFVGQGQMPADFRAENPEWQRLADVIRGSISAIDVSSGQVVHKVMLDQQNRAGVLASAGNWIMVGEPNGWIRAYNATTLDKLWEFNVGSTIKAPPMSFVADGVQYIAIEVGAAPSSNDIKADPMLANFTPDYSLYVFRL
jgi:alcohol dehydrogenase (cytochrome c)